MILCKRAELRHETRNCGILHLKASINAVCARKFCVGELVACVNQLVNFPRRYGTVEDYGYPPALIHMVSWQVFFFFGGGRRRVDSKVNYLNFPARAGNEFVFSYRKEDSIPLSAALSAENCAV